MALLVAVLAACSEDATPPEQRIRQLNKDAEAAAESKDVAALKDMLAAEYRDVNGLDRSGVTRLVQMAMFRYQSLHLYSVTRSLQVLDTDNAVAEVLVAMAGQPVDSADQLFDIRADLMRFNVRYIRQDDEWKVIDVEWRRAAADDFF